MTEDQKELIASEIDNQGFGYWLQQYSDTSLIENNAPEHIIDLAERARVALDLAESAFNNEGLMF